MKILFLLENDSNQEAMNEFIADVYKDHQIIFTKKAEIDRNGGFPQSYSANDFDLALVENRTGNLLKYASKTFSIPQLALSTCPIFDGLHCFWSGLLYSEQEPILTTTGIKDFSLKTFLELWEKKKKTWNKKEINIFFEENLLNLESFNQYFDLARQFATSQGMTLNLHHKFDPEKVDLVGANHQENIHQHSLVNVPVLTPQELKNPGNAIKFFEWSVKSGPWVGPNQFVRGLKVLQTLGAFRNI